MSDASDTLVDFHTGDVYLSFNCDGQGRSNNLELPTPVPQWVNPTTTGAYQAFEMLPRHTYLPNEITCGDNGGSRDYDYNNLPGGECVGTDGGIGACTTIPDGGDMLQACSAKCDETTPGWIAINYYDTDDAPGMVLRAVDATVSLSPSLPSASGAKTWRFGPLVGVPLP